MCELLGMSANVPTDIRFSFSGLMRRGGDTGPHTDGWGIAFYEGKGARVFHDPAPSARSEIAELVRRYPIKSEIVVSHIRRANRGRVELANTHPFTRELWGRTWTFAHNGQLKGVKRLTPDHYQPVGTTDSERAFCLLLGRLRETYPTPPGSLRTLTRRIATLADEIAEMGVFNLLLSDGRFLFCRCSTNLAWITRRAPFGPATLLDDDIQADFAAETTPDDIVTVVATRPLTRDEVWTPMKAGETVVFKDGLPVR